jgi:hypothetical protein
MARRVDVWLPPGYTPTQNYAVVYMHDGQVLFDSTASISHAEWKVDETVATLLAQNKIRPCIIVGIYNTGKDRMREFFPLKVWEKIPEPMHTIIQQKQLVGAPMADAYLKFITQELKPLIDKKYATSPDVSNTFIMGSSMGGLISAYALCEYPQIFGGAACMSIHNPIAAFELMNDSTDGQTAQYWRQYLKAKLPAANTRKIYMDYGDHDLDSPYGPYQQKVDAVVRSLGCDSSHWQTRFFAGQGHRETDWARRLEIPLQFLLK